jgi:hypothetical protein
LKKIAKIDLGLKFQEATQRGETERGKCEFRLIRMGTRGKGDVANIDWTRYKEEVKISYF